MKADNEIMPLLFIGHGSPMNAIEDNMFADGWRSVAAILPKPRAILCISAHWETSETEVTGMERPRTIHDFGGFPKQLYEVQYPAPGSPELAQEVIRLLKPAEIRTDQRWGLDHGCWSILSRMYPQADVPVVQLSLGNTLSPRQHYDLARKLHPLRSKGILIIGSGNMVHNLRLIDWSRMHESNYGYDWALDAQRRMKELILSGDHDSLIDYKKLGKGFELAIPSSEHFLPLLYILALQNKHDTVEFFNDVHTLGSLSMTSVIIGPS